MYTCAYQWLRFTPWRSRVAAVGHCVCDTPAPSNGSSTQVPAPCRGWARTSCRGLTRARRRGRLSAGTVRRSWSVTDTVADGSHPAAPRREPEPLVRTGVHGAGLLRCALRVVHAAE